MGRSHRRVFGPRKTQPPPGDAARRTAVLLVEDDPDEQVVLAHAVRAQSHSVVAASSAAGACALIEQWPVDLVLVSQEIPATTGIEVMRTLLTRHPHLRVVLLTSEGCPGLYAAARDAGAFDCVSRVSVPVRLSSWLPGGPHEHHGRDEVDELLALDHAAQLAE